SSVILSPPARPAAVRIRLRASRLLASRVAASKSSGSSPGSTLRMTAVGLPLVVKSTSFSLSSRARNRRGLLSSLTARKFILSPFYHVLVDYTIDCGIGKRWIERFIRSAPGRPSDAPAEAALQLGEGDPDERRPAVRAGVGQVRLEQLADEVVQLGGAER